mgnify:FL=1
MSWMLRKASGKTGFDLFEGEKQEEKKNMATTPTSFASSQSGNQKKDKKAEAKPVPTSNQYEARAKE